MEVSGAQTRRMQKLDSQIAAAIVILILVGCTLRPDQPIGEGRPPLEGTTPDAEPSATGDHVLGAPELALEPGKGAVIGSVSLVGTRGEETMVFLAPFFHGEVTSEGFFLLEPSVHPHAYLQQDGGFQLTNVEPGEYVLLIGRTPEAASAVRADGQPRIFRISAGAVLDVGELQHAVG